MKRGIALLAVLALIFSACDTQDAISPQVEKPQEPALAKNGGGDEEGDPVILAMIHDVNDQLAEMGLDFAVESIELFTIGNGRPSNRIHQQPFRWVSSDGRRLAQGDDITYMVNPTWGAATASGVPQAVTEADIDAAMATWDGQHTLRKVDLVKRPYPGGDVTFFDGFFGGGFGNAFAADVVNAGWYPGTFFDVVVCGVPGSGCGNNVLALSVTFTFLDSNGNLTDVNGDNYLDTVLNEVYYNDIFGEAGGPLAGSPWATGQAGSPRIDIQTVALHENGHSLGLGHFGPPPSAVMNPVYAGPNITPDPADLAGMATLWNRWPN